MKTIKIDFCIFLSLFLTFTFYENLAQNADLPDSLITIEGTVQDIQTKQPIKAILTYQLFPYSNNVGIAHTVEEEGTYSLNMIDGREYNLEVSSVGYLSQAERVIVRDIDRDGVIMINFELMPMTVGRVMKLSKLFFVQSKADITEDSYPQLDILVKMMKDYPSLVIRLEGHTDYRGSAKLNLELSEDRVDEIKEYLTDRGISRRRIKTQAFGGSQPITTEATEEAQSRNRRVEVRILKN
jgi:outer membrane protein OmpA-like peptidoglycan-associated protein